VSQAGWTPSRATALLLERELFGMRFELDRIKALLKELGDPQNSFRVVHVVGTNGKTSTTRFAASALAAGGARIGAYLSPHLTGFHERVLISGASAMSEVTPDQFASALGRVVESAKRVEEDVLNGELVTQFELVTATALLIFAESGVEVAVVEAGLGGRWDATNVFPSPKTVVLTSVGLDHTRWLGDDVLSIAGEKLAVLGIGDALIIPDNLPADVAKLAIATADGLGATVTVVGDEGATGLELAALGSFQLGNFSLGLAAAEAAAGPLSHAQKQLAAATQVPGRMMVVSDDPVTVVDAAHNAQGAGRLAESVRAFAAGRSITGVIGMLDDKDARSFMKELAGVLERVVVTQPLNPRALPAQALAEVALGAGMAAESVTVESEARAALTAAQAISGKDGVVLATGSIHLVGDLLSDPGERVVSAL